jgi:hypothetical protein
LRSSFDVFWDILNNDDDYVRDQISIGPSYDSKILYDHFEGLYEKRRLSLKSSKAISPVVDLVDAPDSLARAQDVWTFNYPPDPVGIQAFIFHLFLKSLFKQMQSSDVDALTADAAAVLSTGGSLSEKVLDFAVCLFCTFFHTTGPTYLGEKFNQLKWLYDHDPVRRARGNSVAVFSCELTSRVSITPKH